MQLKFAPIELQPAANSRSAYDVQLDNAESSPMNNRRLGELLKKHFPVAKIEGQVGLWRIPLPADEPTEDAGEKLPGKPDSEPLDDKPNADAPAQNGVGPGADDHLPPMLLVMTDERADRMRLMIPIRRFDAQRVEDLQLALIALHANYDRALDARYATHDGLLWSAFIHPLSTLTPQDLGNAINQVRALRDNTGTTYSSSQFIFAPQVDEAGEGAPAENQVPSENNSTDDNVT